MVDNTEGEKRRWAGVKKDGMGCTKNYQPDSFYVQEYLMLLNSFFADGYAFTVAIR